MGVLHEYPAPVLVDDEVEAGYMKHYVPVPTAIADALGGAAHVEGTLGGVPFRRTLQRTPDGGARLRFGAGWLRDAGIAPGAVVTVTLREDPAPDRVDVPPELQAALDQDPGAKAAWAALTPGKQRTLTYGISRGKREETRIRRAVALATALRDGTAA